jgi:large subunit ribosomal protein L7/L12
MSITKEEVVQALGNMTIMEMIKLTKELEAKWGVKAEPQLVKVSPNQNTTAPDIEKAEFNVVLVSVLAEKKMSVIKMVRELLVLGLKESKELVEAAPKMVSEACSKEEAERIKSKLEEAGAVVELK